MNEFTKFSVELLLRTRPENSNIRIETKTASEATPRLGRGLMLSLGQGALLCHGSRGALGRDPIFLVLQHVAPTNEPKREAVSNILRDAD